MSCLTVKKTRRISEYIFVLSGTTHRALPGTFYGFILYYLENECNNVLQ